MVANGDCVTVSLQERRLTAADSASLLAQQMDLLADSITQFAVTNSALRCLLRDQHDHQLNAVRLSEQRDSLLSRLARSQDQCQVHHHHHHLSLSLSMKFV